MLSTAILYALINLATWSLRRGSESIFLRKATTPNCKFLSPQYVFRALVDGEVQEHGSNVKARLYDASNKLGVDVGLAAMLQPNGVKVSLIDTHPILGYKEFVANDSNYVMLSDDGRVSADLVLKAAAGNMGMRVYSNDKNEDALQDITVSMSRFNLDKVLSVIPYMPDITGIMDGDFHFIQTKEELSVSSNLKIDNMTYEKCPMGNVGSEFTYMPKSDGSHYVDAILTYEGDEVATVTGTYKSEGAGIFFDILAILGPLRQHGAKIPESDGVQITDHWIPSPKK